MRLQNRKYSFIRKFLILITVLLLYTGTVKIPKRATTTHRENPPVAVLFPVVSTIEVPYRLNDFTAFKEAIAFKESQGKYEVVNTLGYLGKYQFGKATLKRFKIYDTAQFLKNPKLQESVFLAYCKVNKWILRRDIKRCVGKTINGITITESGILAAAHLGGAGNVKKYLRNNGTLDFSDAYGTSIASYMKKFAGFHVSDIEANRKAKV
ncbi:MAG: peptidoglycan-binding protein LysM [Flavobacteriaceae bacterium]|nr:MAG: peptidoglycan-binding protein LysM [Flavobacteriaceae bacterium]